MSDNQHAQGWISIHRKLRDHWLWQDAEKLKWWIDVLLEVNHKGKKVLIKNTLFEVDRGESINSLLSWANRWQTTRGKVRSFFKLLQIEEMILLKSNQQTTHLTVLNYDKYQGQQPTTRLANGPQLDQQTDTNNNDNTVNNGNNVFMSGLDLVKNGNDFAKQIIKHINHNYKRKFKPNQKFTDGITSRIKEGYTTDDVIKAIDAAYQTKYHSDTDFKYLTPHFFTRADKLEMYANAKPEIKQIAEPTYHQWPS